MHKRKTGVLENRSTGKALSKSMLHYSNVPFNPQSKFQKPKCTVLSTSLQIDILIAVFWLLHSLALILLIYL